MQDSPSSAQRHRERAAECRRLASLATSADTRAEFEQLAENYEELAEIEIALANATPTFKAK
jgi:hypothetical protein